MRIIRSRSSQRRSTVCCFCRAAVKEPTSEGRSWLAVPSAIRISPTTLRLCAGPCRRQNSFGDIMNSFDVDAKIVERKKHFVVYLKEGAQIVDILNVMEAHVALMNLENVRILKEMRNSVNRKVNCETANISKTVNAAVKQLEDITYIREVMGLDSLPDNLKEMALLRLEYPEAPLKELGMYLDPPVENRV